MAGLFLATIYFSQLTLALLPETVRMARKSSDEVAAGYQHLELGMAKQEVASHLGKPWIEGRGGPSVEQALLSWISSPMATIGIPVPPDLFRRDSGEKWTERGGKDTQQWRVTAYRAKLHLGEGTLSWWTYYDPASFVIRLEFKGDTLVEVFCVTQNPAGHFKECFEAEGSLRATLFTLRLVEEYVYVRGMWPSSWKDLESLSIKPGQLEPRNPPKDIEVPVHRPLDYTWPDHAEAVKTLVNIDFEAHPEVMIRESPEKFTAIRPAATYDIYRKYGLIESLLVTMRTRLAAAPTALSGGG